MIKYIIQDWDALGDQIGGKTTHNASLGWSILTNTPQTNHTYDSDQKALVNQLTPIMFASGQVSVNPNKQGYADENIYQDSEDGKYKPNNGQYSDNTNNVLDPAGTFQPAIGTYGNAHIQVVIPPGSTDLSNATVFYHDAGYANPESKDAGEFPGATEHVYNILSGIGNYFHGDKPMSGQEEFPFNNLTITQFEQPASELPQETQDYLQGLIDDGKVEGNNAAYGRDKTIDAPKDKPKAQELAPFSQHDIGALKDQIQKSMAEGFIIEKKDPLRGKDQWFNADDIKPEYPNDPPPEMKGGWHPKLYDQKPNPMVSLERKKRKKEPYIKITEKDLLKNHKLKEEERKVMIKLIGQLNRWIDANPGRIEYIRERYPKNDPRLAMLNYKLDKREEASKKYIETHFPENKSVFERLKRMTRKNIEATQPHRFKSVINPPTYNDYDSHVVMPQLNTNAADTIKIKESFTKHFKKPVRLKSWHKGHLSSS